MTVSEHIFNAPVHTGAATPRGTSPFILAVGAFAFIAAFLFVRHAGDMFDFPADPSAAGFEDLTYFHAIGSLIATDGLDAAYDREVFRGVMPAQMVGAIWMWPPHAALFFEPLHRLSYGMVKGFWLASGAIVLALAAWRAGRASAWAGAALLSPAFLAAVYGANLGAPVAAGLYFAMRWSRTRPILAGALAAALTIKPQYGLLLAVFLIADRRWRAVAAAMAGTAGLVAISILNYGVAPWTAFFASWGEAHAVHGLALHRGTVNLVQLGVKAGLAAPVATALAFAGMIAAGVFVWRMARRGEREAAIGWALVLTPLIAPSAWIYDWPIVATGLIALAGSGKLSRAAGVAAAAAWAAPIIPMFLYGRLAASAASISVLALVVVALFARTTRRVYNAP